MKNGSRLDLSTIDVRSLTPHQWAALKRQIILQARQDRALAIRSAARTSMSWFRNIIAKTWTSVVSHGKPIFPSRGI